MPFTHQTLYTKLFLTGFHFKPTNSPSKGNQSVAMGNGQNSSKVGHRLSWQAGARKETVVCRVLEGGWGSSMGIERTGLWSREMLDPQ